MNDEERKLFQRRLKQCDDLLTDAYIELRRQGTPQESYIAKSISDLLDEVFDKNAEMYYRAVEDTVANS